LVAAISTRTLAASARRTLLPHTASVVTSPAGA
jgi:hypothetical protein